MTEKAYRDAVVARAREIKREFGVSQNVAYRMARSEAKERRRIEREAKKTAS